MLSKSNFTILSNFLFRCKYKKSSTLFITLTTFSFNDQYHDLCAATDLFSRKIISYRISQNNHTSSFDKKYAPKKRQMLNL